ncbi:RDD family protein [Lederbergia wuyishanensis]|uniref:RDD family membrane protein YckC n=1 Tax=Lederbergia wuyishanensis TaxID=1347903 RepID=A0ABU0D077_9BACI|nr:RDD family protein [Lederbergia wuyishanensis]MCJ8006437.1 RDD family protein [Lederbergia wuyishanensis]MDQ0341812.1 putative RDD family membrane protein YckC [Lederbergia wuyishanensis]
MNEDRIDIKTPEYVSLQFQIAGLGSRTSAFIIDQLILMAFNIAILIIFLIISFGQPDFLVFLDLHSYLIAIIIIGLFFINWGYFFAFEYFSGGRTPGKRMMGIRVIQENGHSITLLSSFIRNLLRIIDSLPSGYFLGILMIFFHSKHKRIGDLVAGTIVVHERKTNRKNKLSPIEKEIQARGLSKNDLVVDEWALKSINKQDWKLIQIYSNRFLQLPLKEREVMTKKIAEILFPKLGLDPHEEDLENKLLVIYLILKEEWEYEL